MFLGFSCFGGEMVEESEARRRTEAEAQTRAVCPARKGKGNDATNLEGVNRGFLVRRNRICGRQPFRADDHEYICKYVDSIRGGLEVCLGSYLPRVHYFCTLKSSVDLSLPISGTLKLLQAMSNP